MIITTFISLALILATVVFHYAGLCWLGCIYKKYGTDNFYVPPLLMFGIAIIHLLQIILYALVFYVMHNFTNLGGFTEAYQPEIWNYLYFSGANYTTLGMSEFYPTGHFKILSFTEALNGFMMLTWSATFFYSLAGQIFDNKNEGEK